MEQRQTLKEFEAQWQMLLLPRQLPMTITKNDESKKGSGDDDDDEDPFDCSSVAVPPTHVLADWVADEFVERWRALDQRKISAGVGGRGSDEPDLEGNHDEPQPPQQKRIKTTQQQLPRWYEKHVRLPEQFDYATQQAEPPIDDGTGDRVVSLEDPDATTSYHAELWKLFADIPSHKQLDEEATAGYRLPHTEQLHAEINQARIHTNNLDGHALSRLRMNDRHDPLPIVLPVKDATAPGSCGTTLRLECLRQQMRRGSTPDSNRMVLEFLGTQTLLDVHAAIVELTDDELWRIRDATTATSAGADDEETGDAADTDEHNAMNMASSGYFFIEDTFYTTGPVDYTSPVLEWLKSGNEREQKRRLLHLGITGGFTSVKNMADTRLDEISCRLGIRYVHVHNGDVECAVFVTDRRLVSKAATRKEQFPIIHDIWTPSYTIPECEVCLNRAAAVATSTSCQVTGGHRALCEACCRQLKLPVNSRDKIKRFTVWRGQADLSAGASGDTLW